MDCTSVERWLNEGMPEVTEAPNETEIHLRSCARCSAAVEAARFLESWLATPPEHPPSGFVDRVFRQVRKEQRDQPVARLLQVRPIPWWIRVAANPAAAVAVTLAAVVLGVLADALFPRSFDVVVRSVAEVAGTSFARLSPVWTNPVIMRGVSLGMLPIVALGSIALYEWLGNRAVGRLVLRSR